MDFPTIRQGDTKKCEQEKSAATQGPKVKRTNNAIIVWVLNEYVCLAIRHIWHGRPLGTFVFRYVHVVFYRVMVNNDL